MGDNALAHTAAQGDNNAFATLVKHCCSYIYTIAFKLVFNGGDALDVTQDVFVRLVERIGSFDGRECVQILGGNDRRPAGVNEPSEKPEQT